MVDNTLKRRIAVWLERYTYEHGRTSHRKAIELLREVIALPDVPDLDSVDVVALKKQQQVYVGGDIDPERKPIPWGASEDQEP